MNKDKTTCISASVESKSQGRRETKVSAHKKASKRVKDEEKQNEQALKG